ncbi:MAG: hypothetical protein IKN04_21085 [Clostridia bacterium]|nr:hypothetical protein [Clostridia bacterium]
MKLSIKFETRPGHAEPIYGMMYAGLIAISTLRGYFKLVELPWFVTQFAYISILGLGFVWVFLTGKTTSVNLSLNVMLFQMIPNILILVWSVSLWVYRQEPLSLIMRGSSLVVYQLLVLAMLIGAGILFGGQSIEYTAMGFILANTLILLDVMRRKGVGATVTGMMQFLMSVGGNDNDISVCLEVQDVTFGIGILLMYYLVDGKDEHWRWFYIFALGFYLLMGFKRILFPAVGLGVGYYWLMKKLPRRIQIGITVLIGLVLILISIGYVYLIRAGLWFDICDRFGIDLMGRKRLYGYMEQYYTLSPGYMGMGNGMVSTVLEVLEKSGNRRLHSDVLRMYIELGMPVFLLWCYITFIYTYTYFAKKYSLRAASIYISSTLLMFVTFLTDNTLEKYCPEIAWHVLPMAIILEEKEKLIASFRYRERLLDERTETWKKQKSLGKKKKNEIQITKKEEKVFLYENPEEALKKYLRERKKGRR